MALVALTAAEWLSHPLVLLLAGALVSGVLLPLLGRRWQDHAKALELKSALTDQLTEAVSEILLAVQFAELGAASQSQEDFDRAYLNWEIRKSKIGARVHAYFAHSDLDRQWSDLATSVTDLYVLTGIVEPPDRSAFLAQMGSRGVLRVDEEQRAALADRSATGPYRAAWAAVQLELSQRRDRLVREVLGAPVRALTGGRASWRNRRSGTRS